MKLSIDIVQMTIRKLPHVFNREFRLNTEFRRLVAKDLPIMAKCSTHLIFRPNEINDLEDAYTSKLCVFRFVQECLSNSLKHTDNAIVEVKYRVSGDMLTVTVCDNGPGFDIDTALTLREDGGQGLLGLIDRAESIGGNRVEAALIATDKWGCN
jgi:signal transduction histidine kinase